MSRRRSSTGARLLCALIASIPFASALASSPLIGVTTPTGPARRWGAGLPVTPFSEIDMRTGRVVTALPVVSWSGRGPSISLTLYHNMSSPYSRLGSSSMMGDANFDDELTEDDISPFVDIIMEPAQTTAELEVGDYDGSEAVDETDLGGLVDSLLLLETGPVWTHTYQTCLQFVANGIYVIWGDGTKDFYLSAGGGWTTPPGVYAPLTATGTPPTSYTVTLKNQVMYQFLADGRLDAIEDPSGNRVTCHYINNPSDPADGELDYVQDAAGRVLDFNYNIHGNSARLSLHGTRRMSRFVRGTCCTKTTRARPTSTGPVALSCSRTRWDSIFASTTRRIMTSAACTIRKHTCTA